MMEFAQIQNNKVHWVFEAEEKPEFAPNIVLLGITDYPQVQEGWGFVDDEFVDPTPTLEDLKTAKVVEILALSAGKVSAIEAGYSVGEVKTLSSSIRERLTCSPGTPVLWRHCLLLGLPLSVPRLARWK